MWLLLMIWERHVTLTDSIREPTLPWRLFQHRASIGLLGQVHFLIHLWFDPFSGGR